MDATFLAKIRSDFPEIKFRQGKKFAYRPPRTVIVGPKEPGDELLLLHELGHALSGHCNFSTDAMRLKMEREAWEKARELASKYGVEFNEAAAEAGLDTYREWLHQKSSCPSCGLTRYQTPDGAYHCPRCEAFRV